MFMSIESNLIAVSRERRTISGHSFERRASMISTSQRMKFEEIRKQTVTASTGATATRRASADRISIFQVCCLNRRATPSGSAKQTSRPAFTAKLLPSRAPPDDKDIRPQKLSVVGLEVVLGLSWERHLGDRNGSSHRSREEVHRREALLQAETWPRGVPGDQRAGRLPLLSQQRRASQTRAQPSSTPLGAVREVVEGGLTARGIHLPAFQDGGVAHQEKALHGIRRPLSRRQAEDHRGAEIGNEVFGGAAQRRPCRWPAAGAQARIARAIAQPASAAFPSVESGVSRSRCKADTLLFASENTAVARTSNDQVEASIALIRGNSTARRSSVG